MKHQLKLLRVYDLEPDTTGKRILVDRLWPRGISKTRLGEFTWAKDIAPTNDLRKWFGHDSAKYDEFARKYLAELEASPKAAEFANNIRSDLQAGDVLLLCGAKSETQKQAVVLNAWLEKQL